MIQTITDQLAAALRDAVDNGLIYWEPQTSKGVKNKALMFMRINKTLAAYDAAKAQEPSELVKRLRYTREILNGSQSKIGSERVQDCVFVAGAMGQSAKELKEAADRIEEHDAECLALGDEIVALRKELEAALAPVTDAEVEAALNANFDGMIPKSVVYEENVNFRKCMRAALEAAAKARAAPSITHDNVSGLAWDASGRIIHEPRDEP